MIQIDMAKYSAKVRQEMESLYQSVLDRRERVKQIQLDESFIEKLKQATANYPGQAELLQAIQNQDIQRIQQTASEWYKWGVANDHFLDIRSFVRTLWDYADSHTEANPQEYLDLAAQLERETYANMQVISQNIQQAIERIADWQGSSITIKPFSQNLYDYEGEFQSERSADIIVGSGNDGFTYFGGENPRIDDVLEGGDVSFFQNPQNQSDYFSLINELRNPGSSQIGKTITLYTARPRRDRAMMENATSLPQNVFLTKTMNHAIGLALDLAGGNEIRDVYRVKVNQKDLVETLSGRESQFQVIRPNTPAQIQLVWSED